MLDLIIEKKHKNDICFTSFRMAKVFLKLLIFTWFEFAKSDIDFYFAKVDDEK